MTRLPAELEERARRLHRQAFVFDGCLLPGSLMEDSKYRDDLFQGGVKGANLTLSSSRVDFLAAINNIVTAKRVIETDSRFALCTTVREIEGAKRNEKFGVVFHFQSAKPVGDNVDRLRTFYDLGVRVVCHAHLDQNYVATGVRERHDAPLPRLGLELLAELESLGMTVDISHLGDASSWGILQHAKKPVVASHSNALAICNACGRNKPDDMIKAIARSGGLIGVVFVPAFVKKDPATNRVLPSTVSDVLDHLDYIAKLVGVDHVAFGSDVDTRVTVEGGVGAYSSAPLNRVLRPDVFGAADGEPRKLEGLERPRDFLNLTRGLVARGYKDEEVAKVLGGNWLRVFKDTWKG